MGKRTDISTAGIREMTAGFDSRTPQETAHHREDCGTNTQLRYKAIQRDHVAAKNSCAWAVKLLVGIQQNCDGAFVDDFRRHASLENARLSRHSHGAQSADKLFVERRRRFRRSGLVKSRATAAANIAIERELRKSPAPAPPIWAGAVPFPCSSSKMQRNKQIFARQIPPP